MLLLQLFSFDEQKMSKGFPDGPSGKEPTCSELVQMRRPAQGATGGWVMPGLVFKWFPLCEFSLFDTPSVSSLVVQGLGVSAPTPKAQGLISGQERIFHKWFVIA